MIAIGGRSRGGDTDVLVMFALFEDVCDGLRAVIRQYLRSDVLQRGNFEDV